MIISITTDKKNFSSKESIIQWLEENNIKNYTINNDLTVDVDSSVYLNSIYVTKEPMNFIPIQFGVIKGHFYATACELTSLKGTPNKVLGTFDCSGNNLTSLEFGPTEVRGDYSCQQNNLETLQGSPVIISGNFFCMYNNLKNLDGIPKFIKGYFNCCENDLRHLHSLDSEIEGNFIHEAQNNDWQIHLLKNFYVYDKLLIKNVKHTLNILTLNNKLNKELLEDVEQSYTRRNKI